MIADVGTTEGTPTIAPAGSGKPDPLLVHDSPALCATVVLTTDREVVREDHLGTWGAKEVHFLGTTGHGPPSRAVKLGVVPNGAAQI
uniref:Uncharacterized protein n=1 Tax=Solanum tuberosum TaxID=4113 RepID=M1DNK6_SOLTU